MSMPPRPRRCRGDFTTHFGLFLFFLVFPAAFTAITPRATVELRRNGPDVSATVCAHTLLVVPYWCRQERRVARVELELDRGERVGYNPQLPESMNELRRRGRTEDSASIHFLGDGEGAGAMIEIARMDSVLADTQAFLADPARESLSFSFYAHRALGLYVGLPLSLLVLFVYLPLTSLAVVRRVLGRPYWPFA